MLAGYPSSQRVRLREKIALTQVSVRTESRCAEVSCMLPR